MMLNGVILILLMGVGGFGLEEEGGQKRKMD